jgi:hypothetical protein
MRATAGPTLSWLKKSNLRQQRASGVLAGTICNVQLPVMELLLSVSRLSGRAKPQNTSNLDYANYVQPGSIPRPCCEWHEADARSPDICAAARAEGVDLHRCVRSLRGQTPP